MPWRRLARPTRLANLHAVQAAQDAFAVGEFGEQVPLARFLALQAAVVAPGLLDTLFAVAAIYGNEDSETTLDRAVFEDVCTFLCQLDDIPDEQLEAVLAQLEGSEVRSEPGPLARAWQAHLIHPCPRAAQS